MEVWHLAVLAILLILGFVWEIKKQKPRKVWRIIALLLAFISLYIIYLSPYTLSQKPLQSILLVNQNISENELDSIRREYDLPLLQRQANSKFKEMGKAEVESLNQLDFQIDTAFVYGYFPQLNPNDYQIRKDIELQKGIQIDYPKSIALGDSLKISIQNLESKASKILAAIGNDSISKTIEANRQISLATLPKATGYILAEIKVEEETYHFAIMVIEKEKYVIQILAATPDFEWKFFADYLKFQEHSVYLKTQISIGKFKSSFFNWHDSLQFTRGVANDLKVLFTDAKAWQDLALTEQNQYLKKLKENRGSLIFRNNPNSKIRLDLDKSKSTNIFSTSDNLLEQNNYNYLQFNNLYQLDEVAQNSIFRKVTPDVIYGVINFQNSFQLKLSGKNQEYEGIWTPVFSDLIRSSTELFYDKSEWAVQHQPFFFRLWSGEALDEISIFNLQNDTIKLKSNGDFLYPERKHFMFYPKQGGWHFIQLKTQSDAIPFFVHAESIANHSEFLSNYNLDYLNYRNFTDSNAQQRELKYTRESVTLWFFLMFLLCVGHLWIEDKIA